MNDKITEFGIICREKRLKLKLTMAQAADKIGVKQSTISKIEHGNLPPPIKYIKKSIEIYEIKDIKEQKAFLLSSLKSSKKIDIPLDKIGPLRKEWLSALLTLGDLDKKHPNGWEELLSWMKDFNSEVKKLIPQHITGGDPDPL